MKKRIAIVLVVVSIIMVMGGIGSFALISNINGNKGDSVWTEVPIVEGQYVGSGSISEFDPQKIVTDADYVFSGTVMDRHEYEVEWTDENGEPWGPFRKSVIEVKVDKEYFGTSPSESDVVKIYYPYSLSMTFENSFLIQDDGKYVFITRALDEKFVQFRNANSPHDRFEQENHADVYISDPCFDIMPIEGDTTIMYHDYFSWDTDTANQIYSDNLPETDKISSSALAEQGFYIAMDTEDFDVAFPQLFINPDTIPNADALLVSNSMDNENSDDREQ